MKRRVLLVDDNYSIQYQLEAYLDDGSWLFEHATSADVALPMIQRCQPDLVLIDIELGGRLDGLLVLRQLKTNSATHHFRVAIISPYVGANRIREALEAGADAYFTKPFSARTMLKWANTFE